MRLQVIGPAESKQVVLEMLGQHQAEVVDCRERDEIAAGQDVQGLNLTCLVEPGGFRKIFSFMNENFGTRATVQVRLLSPSRVFTDVIRHVGFDASCVALATTGAFHRKLSVRVGPAPLDCARPIPCGRDGNGGIDRCR
jgi:hypothetical protein